MGRVKTIKIHHSLIWKRQRIKSWEPNSRIKNISKNLPENQVPTAETQEGRSRSAVGEDGPPQ